MDRAPINSVCLLCLTFLFLGAKNLSCYAQQPLPQDSLSTNLPIREISAHLFEIGGVRFDKKLRTAEFPAKVNMTTGPVEYLLVSTAGKFHESVLTTEIEPYHLHLAMLLLNAKVTSQKAFPGEPIDVFEGDPITLTATYQTGDKKSSVPAEDWIYKEDVKKSMERGPWIYTGSKVLDGTFLAQRDRSIISLITDPYALVNNPRKGHENDKAWSVNEKSIPPLGTPVILTLKLEPQKSK